MGSSLFDIASYDEYDHHEFRSAPKVTLQWADAKNQWRKKQRIFVITLWGNKIAIEIESSDTLGSVKNSIKDAEGIPTHPWTLFLKGTQLEENRTLANYNIAKNCTLRIGFQFREGAHILVKTLNKIENPFTMEINKFDTFSDVQTKIFYKTGVPNYQQRLIFGGKLIEHGVFVDQMDMIQARLFESGYPFSSDSISERNGSHPAIWVCLRLRGGGNAIYHTPIWYDSCPTVDSSSNSNGDEVSKRPPLPYLPPGSQDASQMRIVPETANERADARTKWLNKQRILVKTLRGDTITVEIESSDTPESVRNKIKGAKGIPTHPWSLFLRGTQLEENRTLENYNIEENSILRIGFQFRGGAHVLVKTTSSKNRITMEINKFDTFSDVQTKIFHQTGLPPNQQRVLFGDTQLQQQLGLIVDQMDMIQAGLFESGYPFCSGSISGRKGSHPAISVCQRLRGGGNAIYHTPVWDDSCTTANSLSKGQADEVARRPPPQYLPPRSQDKSEIRNVAETVIQHADVRTQSLNEQKSGFPKFSDTNSGELLSIKPQELKFPFKLRKQVSCTLHLSNKTDNYVAFKVKTSNPKKYCVRPKLGVVSPHSMCQVTIIMQAPREAPPDLKCKDRFLIQSVVASPGNTTKDFDPKLFEFGNVIEECKLRVVYILPSQTPPTVYQETRKGLSPGLPTSGNRSLNDTEVRTRSQAFNEPQATSLEGMILIRNYYEERDFPRQQGNKLRMEAESLRCEENRSSIDVLFFYVVIVGILCIILCYR